MKTRVNKVPTTENELKFCPLWRRLAAIIYDFIMLVCLVFIAWQPVPLLPDQQWPPVLSQAVRLIYLGLICFLFFGWFWTHGGQTIGMRAWRVKLVGRSNHAPHDEPGIEAVTWKSAALRFACSILSWAVFGLGFFWSLFNRDRQSWHDLASSTCLIVVAKPVKP